jgi:hypothetical protein
MLMRTTDSVSEIIKQIGQHKSFKEILNNIDSMTSLTPVTIQVLMTCRSAPQSNQSDVH